MTIPFDTICQDGWLGYPPELEQDRGTYEGRAMGTAALWMRQGVPVPTADQASRPDWGLDGHSKVFDESDQFSNPSAASERIEQFDIQRCVDVDPNDIVSTGVAFELLHWLVPASHVALVERLPTILQEVTSLDVDGVPFFTHGNLNGLRPCTDVIPHADAVIAPLQWRYYFTWSDRASLQPVTTDGTLGYRGPTSESAIAGNNVIPPWSDLRYGHLAIPSSEQFIFPPGCLIRYWVLLTGPTARFRVKIGARLVGYNQSCGRKGSALQSVLQRHV